MVGTYEERMRVLDELYPTWKGYSLWEYFEENSQRFFNKEFLVYSDCSFSYGDIYQYALQAAQGLRVIGVKKGSHIAVCMNNIPEYIALIFAIAKVGGVKVSVNTNVGEDEMQYIVDKADVEYCFCQEKRLLPILKNIGKIKKIVSMDEEDNGICSWKDFLRMRCSETEDVGDEKIDIHALCDIMFTSGSTSTPKGVMMTHDMITSSGYATARSRGMEPGRRICVPIPLFHAFAYVEGLFAAITVGGTLLLFKEKFNTDKTLLAMQERKANDIICVSPIMIDLLVKGKPSPERFPVLHAAYWAAACPEWIWDRARQAFGISDISTGYGMTECGSTATIIRPEDDKDRVKVCHGRLKSGGRAAIDPDRDALLEIRIQNIETGEETGIDETGEVLLRGRTMTPGYYKDAVVTQHTIDQDGWFHTGDLGILDEKGYLKFLGRSNDMYKINGENVSPQFVESILSRHEAVNVVEVVGIGHEKCGEVGVAFIDTDRPTEGLEEELRIYAKEHLARFQCPYYYIFMKRHNWPRTETGKISKKELRKVAVSYIQHHS